MHRRQGKTREEVMTAQADCAGGSARKARAHARQEAQREHAPTIEISDADYRTLHMPCDALEESDDGAPGN